jgi:hypothetical protein
MKTLKCIFGLAIVAAIWSGGSGVALGQSNQVAASTSGTSTNSVAKTNEVVKFKVNSVKLQSDGVDYGSQTFINTGKEVIALQAPENCRVKVENNGRELLVYAPDSNSQWVSIRYEDAPGEVNFDSARPLVLKRLDKAKVAGEYDTAAMGTKGVGFDLTANLGGQKWEGRAVVVACGEGKLIISAFIDEAGANDLFFLMRRVISSLQQGAGEKELRRTIKGTPTS